VSAGIPKVNIAVQDRVLLHLFENDEQADRYLTEVALTRPGIAESCALHPPNVSRTMRDLLKKQYVSEHTRNIRGEERRQKTWQLTDEGRTEALHKHKSLGKNKVVLRDEGGELLEVEALEAAERLATDISLLQILMHAQHEGVLTYGDIRFGKIKHSKQEEIAPPGRLTALTGVHSTYNNQPPNTRPVHGRKEQIDDLKSWFSSRKPCAVVHGIAGIGKSTLVAHWLKQNLEINPGLSICWYPCQPWDRALGIATSLLHRFGIDESHDPYNLIETLPLQPAGKIDVDNWRRRLTAYLTDADTIRERFKDDSGGPPPYWLIILDDVHHIESEAKDLLGALLQISTKTPLRLLLISRTKPTIYDRRDVHTRGIVTELSLQGLTKSEIKNWLKNFDSGDKYEVEQVHEKTGGHPLALELFELYGQETHVDWLQFLDDEIILRLPELERKLLLELAKSDAPLNWNKLADTVGWKGNPPKDLIQHGLLLELEDGMWLHEALKERLLRDVN
jgi:DNA-binding MarR family transcriptional regulator